VVCRAFDGAAGPKASPYNPLDELGVNGSRDKRTRRDGTTHFGAFARETIHCSHPVGESQTSVNAALSKHASPGGTTLLAARPKELPADSTFSGFKQ